MKSIARVASKKFAPEVSDLYIPKLDASGETPKSARLSAKTPSKSPKASRKKQVKTSDEIADDDSEIVADGGTVNGFDSVSEPLPLQVVEGNIAPYSLPQEVLAIERAPLIVQKFSNGDQERKIYCNVELDADEQRSLAELQQKARSTDAAFYPSVSVTAGRCLSHARGDVDKALGMLIFTQRWRMSFFKQPLRDVDLLEDLRLGICYWVGRDFRLTPTMVFRAKRIPPAWVKAKEYDRIIKLFVFCIEYFINYMTLAGRVESFNLIIDLDGVGISQIPVSALTKIQKTMGGHYPGRCLGTFVCNLGWTLRSLVGMAKGLMTERQVQKLCFVKDAKVGAEFKEKFAAHQLEQDFGGTRPPIKEFFPFPMAPGPYEAGSSQGPASNPVPGCVEAFTRADIRGRLWDSSLSQEENTRREYTEKAAGIFKACGLPVPPECEKREMVEAHTDTKVSCLSAVGEEDVKSESGIGGATNMSEEKKPELKAEDIVVEENKEAEVEFKERQQVPPPCAAKPLLPQEAGQTLASDVRPVVDEAMGDDQPPAVVRVESKGVAPLCCTSSMTAEYLRKRIFCSL